MSKVLSVSHPHKKHLSFAELLTHYVHASSSSSINTTIAPINDDTNNENKNANKTAQSVEMTNALSKTDDTELDDAQQNITTKVLKANQMDFDVIPQNGQPVSTEYLIAYYALRLFSIALTVFIAVLSINYAYGQLFVLTTANFMCDDYNSNAVREHNLQNHNPEGTSGNCWKIHRPEVDTDTLIGGDPYRSKLEINAVNIIGCISFLCLAVLLIHLAIYHLYYSIYDAYYHFIQKQKKNPRILAAIKYLEDAKQSKCNYCPSMIQRFCGNLKQFEMVIFKYYYPDSKLKIVFLIASEVLNLLAQTWALLVYGGVQISFSFVVATESTFVLSFAAIVGCNAMCVGILWILYIIKFHRYARIFAFFHGTSFESLLFLVDMIFFFAYTIFPFTLYTKHGGTMFNTKSLARLHSEDGVLIFAAFVASFLLWRQCATILENFDPVIIENRSQQISEHRIETRPFIEHEQSENDNNKKQLHKRICIGSIGLLFFISGLVTIIAINQYINDSYELCSNPSASVLKSNPELNYWKSGCSEKIIPFVSIDEDSPPCDCRTFNYYFTKNDYENGFENDHVISLMSHWRMLTSLFMEPTQSLYRKIVTLDDSEIAKKFTLNLTDECFIAPKLRSLYIRRMGLVDVKWQGNDGIKTYRDHLEVLFLGDSQFKTDIDWDSIGALSSLKLLSFSESQTNTETIQNGLCKLKELRYFDISYTSVQSMPQCIFENWKKLIVFKAQEALKLEYINPELFNLPSIVSVVAYWTQIDNNSIPIEWSDSLQSVFLQATNTRDNDFLCNHLTLLSDLQLDFTTQFGVCDKPCTGLDWNSNCPSYEWGDGKCNKDCCDYDNGDCFQSCKCDNSLWLNGQCDIECNNTNCAWDFGECLKGNVSSDLNTECVEGSGCLDSWITDGWCDADCQALDYSNNSANNSVLCDDYEDCEQYGECVDDCFDAWKKIIKSVAAKDSPKELIDVSELCANDTWSFVTLYESEYQDCILAFPFVDINNDSYVSFWEALQIMKSVYGLTEQKAFQLNCSSCLQNQSLYY